jgi:hypothetical protein
MVRLYYDDVGGGNLSDFAICTMGYENMRHVVRTLTCARTHTSC